jgi:hypothetical protein
MHVLFIYKGEVKTHLYNNRGFQAVEIELRELAVEDE